MKKSIELLKLLAVFIAIGIIFGILTTLAITALALDVGEAILSESAFEGYLSPQQSFAENFTDGLMMTLQSGLLFGFLMFLIVVIPNFITGGTMSLQHKRDIVVPLPYDQSFALCISSLRLISNYKIKREDAKKGRITAKIKFTRNSPPNTFYFRLYKINGNKTRVQIINRGRPIAIIRADNMEKIIPFLTSSRKIQSQ